MLLSIVFSFRNEEAILDELLRRVRKVLDSSGIGYELVFVNDDSTDKSLAILLKQRGSDGKIKIINMARRFGVAHCVLAGMKYSKGDAVVVMDTDLQDPPELMLQMIAKWQGGADVVNTVREKRLGENMVKMWITKKAYNIINFVSDIDLPENMGDFKLLSRRVVDELIKLNEYDPYLRGLVRWLGFRQEVIYYTREPRFGGETHFSLFGMGPVKEFIRGITSFSAAPLYLAILLGLTVSAMSFVLIGYVLYTKFHGLTVPGWAGPMVAILFIGGIILFTNGLLGLYIGRIYNQVKNRPHYIVESAHGFDES
ncbi:MAG TPA: glycosyltransferase [Elusimicrobia bacterium]|nr:glycosyltransferase [Elusimicrobiota bacterium]